MGKLTASVAARWSGWRPQSVVCRRVTPGILQPCALGFSAQPTRWVMIGSAFPSYFCRMLLRSVVLEVGRRDNSFLDQHRSAGWALCSLKGPSEELLVVRRVGVCLPMQGTRVQSLVRGDSTCQGQLEPAHRSY